MKYDLFTHDEVLAEQICRFSDRAYLVDTTENPDTYQFFGLTDDTMFELRKLINANSASVEIRGSVNGEMIWPADSGVGLEQALDILV